MSDTQTPEPQPTDTLTKKQWEHVSHLRHEVAVLNTQMATLLSVLAIPAERPKLPYPYRYKDDVAVKAINDSFTPENEVDE